MNPKLLLTISAVVIFALAATVTINQEPAAKEKSPGLNEVEREPSRPYDQALSVKYQHTALSNHWHLALQEQKA